MKKVLIVLGIIIVANVVLFMIPAGPRTISYRSVTERGPLDDDVVVVHDNPRGDYLVRNNKLYLNVQETQGMLVLVTEVSQTRWTAACNGAEGIANVGVDAVRDSLSLPATFQGHRTEGIAGRLFCVTPAEAGVEERRGAVNSRFRGNDTGSTMPDGLSSCSRPQGDSMDKKTLPEKIECTVSHEGKPVAGLMLDAKLAVEAKNPYSLAFGPTGADGRAILTYQAIKEWTDQEMNLAMMDYHPLEGVFAGVVELSVTSREGIDRALKAYEMFNPWFKYPANYADNLHQARKVLDRLSGHGRLQVSGTVTPESIKLMIRQQTGA